jgi:drug/metabolite transporter (DMT)-like permease
MSLKLTSQTVVQTTSRGECGGGEWGERSAHHGHDNKHLEQESQETAAAAHVALGGACAVLAGLCFTAGQVLVKFAPEMDAPQLLFVRCLVQVAAMLPIMGWTRSHPFGGGGRDSCLQGDGVSVNRWLLLTQSFLGGCLLLTIFLAVRRLPLGDAQALFSCAPAITLILSAALVYDRFGLVRAAVIACLLAGSVILIRPPALFTPLPTSVGKYAPNIETAAEIEGYEPLGMLAGILVPILSTFVVILGHITAMRRVHYSLPVFWIGLGGLIFALIAMFTLQPLRPVIESLEPVRGVFEGWAAREWVLAVLLALLGVAGNVLMTVGLQWITPSRAMILRGLEVLAAYFLQVIISRI